jgi:hypothetical protein
MLNVPSRRSIFRLGDLCSMSVAFAIAAIFRSSEF